jgi:hypothetical protein
MRKVTICASASLPREIEVWRRELEYQGYRVIQFPPVIFKNYAKGHRHHFQKIAESDIVFILNLKKKGIKNYIGPSVFAEIAFAIGLNLALRKKIKIYCLNPLPRKLPCSPELEQWKRAGWIHFWKKGKKGASLEKSK